MQIVLIYRFVQIMLRFAANSNFGFFLDLDGLLGFESLLWHVNGSWGGRIDLSQNL